MQKTLAYLLLCVLTSSTGALEAQQTGSSWSEKMGRTVMSIWKDSIEMEKSGRRAQWAYFSGVVLEGMTNIWRRTGDGEYFNYVQRHIDPFIDDKGNIRGYHLDEYNLDQVKNGRILLTLYKVTGNQKYYKAAALLRKQMLLHPRTKEGGRWHQLIYPYQMWLDGLYMSQPFEAEYAAAFKDGADFNDIADQFIFMENHARDDQSGLLYHGWDESKQASWADKKTGLSKSFWGRSMGWYGMGLVDVLEYFPQDHPKQKKLIAILNRLAEAVTRVQDPKTGLWYLILDKPGSPGNYFEASACNMFIYTLSKGTRLGFLPEKYNAVADKAFKGVISELIETDNDGMIKLNGTIGVAGLDDKRDGSYEYYTSEKVKTNDPKGVGSFLLASNEMELKEFPKTGLGKTIMLDNYFNNEFKDDKISGRTSWHYTWNDMSEGGFYLWGEHARYLGAKTTMLKSAPLYSNLKSCDIYIIVDPDTDAETVKPNFVSGPDIATISKWVKNGGILVLMANDSGNAELKNFNLLAKRFGLYFQNQSVNLATPYQVVAGNPLFKRNYVLYLKNISPLLTESPATPVITNGDKTIMAIAKYGKGTVFAVGDPWLYNEYIDGRYLPSSNENLKAGDELLNWLLNQVPKK